MSKIRTIALVDWHWNGHHPTYFNYFILALEALGIGVLAICPNPLEAEETANNSRLAFGGEVVGRGQTQFATIRIPVRRFTRLRPDRISAIDWTIRQFRGIEQQVREWCQVSGKSVDLIFYPCMYDWDFEWAHLAQRFLRLPWMGLYLHAMSYRTPGQVHPRTGKVPRPEVMFRGRMCRGLSILDEGIVEQVAQSIGKPVVVLPDLADQRPAVNAEDRILGERLKCFAAGRPVVGLFGHLQKSKGLTTFLEAASMAQEAGICFALGGEINWSLLEESEAWKMQRTLAQCPNIWNHLARIPGEPCLNDMMGRCDVIFAGYWDFPHSSGIQSKAAFLKKPLIISDGFLMAERARRYHLGEIIPQKDPRALFEAIVKITQDQSGWVARHQPRWTDYCQDHSFGRFKAGLKEMIASL